MHEADTDTWLLSGSTNMTTERKEDKREGWMERRRRKPMRSWREDRWSDMNDEMQRGWALCVCVCVMPPQRWTMGGRRRAIRKLKAAEIFMVK